jgi:hypothetical protein
VLAVAGDGGVVGAEDVDGVAGKGRVEGMDVDVVENADGGCGPDGMAAITG